jgi:hypothetical protein
VRKARPFEQLPRAPSQERRAQIYSSGNRSLFELQVNAATSGVHSNAALCGGNSNYHTSLI